MALELIEKDNKFRVKLQVNFTEAIRDSVEGGETQTEGNPKEQIYVAQGVERGRKPSREEESQGMVFYTGWLPDTPMNRQMTVVWLRLLVDEQGQGLIPLKELAQIVGSPNRQAASQHVEDFRERGEEFKGFVERQRKVDAEVGAAVQQELEKDLWVSLEGLAKRVNQGLGREDLTGVNIGTALDELSGRWMRGAFLKAIQQGKAHYEEGYVLRRLFEMVLEKSEAPELASELEEAVGEAIRGGTEPVGERPKEMEEGLGSQEEMALERLFAEQGEVSPEQVASIWEGKLGWKVLALVLYGEGVSQSAIGGWLGVHKSTVCRWLSEVAQWGEVWIKQQRVCFSGRMAVDEKWIWVEGRWQYVFAAVDCLSGYPLHVALYPSNGGESCKLFLLEVKQLGYKPKVVVTDGWDGYIEAIKEVFPEAEHLLCRFHVIRALFRRLRKAKIWEAKVWEFSKKLFQSPDKRTVLRRVNKLQELLEELNQGAVGRRLLAKLPQVLPAVGSTWRPSTSNAVESFFSGFDRFYRIKGPFQDEASARKHVALFMLYYIFKIGADGQASVLEKGGKLVGKVPMYHLVNRPHMLKLRERMAGSYRLAA